MKNLVCLEHRPESIQTIETCGFVDLKLPLKPPAHSIQFPDVRGVRSFCARKDGERVEKSPFSPSPFPFDPERGGFGE